MTSYNPSRSPYTTFFYFMDIREDSLFKCWGELFSQGVKHYFFLISGSNFFLEIFYLRKVRLEVEHILMKNALKSIKTVKNYTIKIFKQLYIFPF